MGHRLVRLLTALGAMTSLVACPESRGRGSDPPADAAAPTDTGDPTDAAAPIDTGPRADTGAPTDTGARPDSGARPDGAFPGDTGTGSAGLCPGPTVAPNAEGLMGECCYRRTNADRPTAPELRVSGITVTAPASLAGSVVGGLLASALDGERLNWLMALNIGGANATIRTGHGQWAADSTFEFVMGAAPPTMGGSADRWNPVDLMGSLAGETITAPPGTAEFTIPVFLEETGGLVLSIELPFRNFELLNMDLTSSRSCVGARLRNRYDTTAGSLSAYITVAASSRSPLRVGTSINTTLCMFAAGMPGELGNCTDHPQTAWPVQPDSICDGSGCRPSDLGVNCDPGTTCNAWQVVAGFSAQGVEITN